MSPRRTDTRQRAIEVALDLFTEQGYDSTSLREIAERLGIKKASLYYHFPSKEALLAGIMESLLAPVDELVAWGQSQPRSAETRQEVLRRIAALLQGPWSRWIRFVQENQPAMRSHRAEGDRFQPRMLALLTVVVDPHADPRQQVRSLLGLVAVYLRNIAAPTGALPGLGIEMTAEEMRAAAMDIAMGLVEEA
jgi:AcrR family transcriptional regulator